MLEGNETHQNRAIWFK